ncbi:ComEC/Rec2 family competence protein [Actinomadura craniellae]|uniref:ComEC/Rec2 family competence protein n=1 Tax=Actinomadura craniellae TaxID=2231787 RepID=UPI001F21DC9F|nr:ComEC/Rec2 family competence protein [Actinomadura craniellae]
MVVPALACWLTAGVLLGASPLVASTVAALFLAVALPLLAAPLLHGVRFLPGVRSARGGARGGTWAAAVAAALVCASAAAFGTGARVASVESGPVRELAGNGARVRIEAVVTADPLVRSTPRGDLTVVRVRAETVRHRGRAQAVRVPVLVLATAHSGSAISTGPEWRELVPSRRVRFEGRLALPQRRELLAAVVFVRGPPRTAGEPSAPQRAAATVRARLREAAEVLPADQRGVLPGMVVGDTSGLDPGLAEDFRTAGLSHLLVVSGANLAIIVGALLGLCRWCGLGRRAPLVAVLAVPVFVLVARPEPSVLRATVMGLIGLLALATGRERHGLSALGAAVLVLVLADPGLARSYGFALSVLATGGLLVLAPGWRARLLRRGLPAPVAEVLALAAAAQVACAPVAVMLSGEVGLAAVAANLVVAPAVAPATLLGALAAAVAPFALRPAQLLVWPAGLAVGWIAAVARTTAAIPYATIPWRDGAAGAVLLLGAGAVAVAILRYRPARRIAAAAVAGVLVAVLAQRALAPGWPPRGWSLVACDVGQGDAVALAAGPGRAVVVDTGPEPAAVDRCLDDLGVHAVPLLILTHPHADHIGGVAGVRRGRPVGVVMTSPLTGGPEARAAPGLAARPAGPGQRWSVGPLELSVLGPASTGPRVPARADGTTVNNASLILVARLPGLSALLTGDVETEVQRSLAPHVPAVDVFKVPHHGSNRFHPGFFAASRAAIAVTSVGRANDYGHPAPATLALLRGLGMRSYRTDHHGDIAVLRDGARLVVVTRRP